MLRHAQENAEHNYAGLTRIRRRNMATIDTLEVKVDTTEAMEKIDELKREFEKLRLSMEKTREQAELVSKLTHEIVEAYNNIELSNES